MNREIRIVRPFLVEGSIARILDSALLRFGVDECASDGRIEVDDPDDYRRRSVEVSWVPDHAFGHFKTKLAKGITEVGIDPTALALLITASSSYLKITEIVFIHQLSDLDGLPPTVELSAINPQPKALLTGFHGAVITIYLLLTEDVKPLPLRPWRKGTWLVRTKFTLSSRSTTSLFQLTALNDEERKRHELPDEVMCYLYIGDHNPLGDYEDSYPPTFYVDEKVLVSLDARPNTKLSRSIQIKLVHEFIWGVLTSPAVMEANLEDLVWADIEGTLIGRIINLAAGTGATDNQRRTLIRLIRSDQAKFMAHVEHAIGLRKILLSAIGEE